MIKVLGHSRQVLTKIDGFSLLWELIDKIEDRFGGMMIVLIDHGLP